jgi:hypothetical protein
MSDDVKQRRANDSLQGGEGNPAYGEDARALGVGGQRDQRALDTGHKDPKERQLGRDPTARRPKQAETTA